ncbi:MAG: methyltransferase, partial [Rickettsiales bacterium]|nr:methyltransferase [Rickettsiales bacterium]
MVVARNKTLRLKLNHFFNQTVHLYQSDDHVKTSMDTILLAASINASKFKKQQKIFVLDVGSGIGGGDVLLSYRLKNTDIIGIEIQQDLIEIAKKNAKKNCLEDRIDFVNFDIADNRSHILKKDGFDWVMTNPPFHIGETSPLKNKSISYTENDISLQK